MSRLLWRHFRDVTLAITEITLSRMTLAPSAIFAPRSDSPSEIYCKKAAIYHKTTNLKVN